MKYISTRKCSLHINPMSALRLGIVCLAIFAPLHRSTSDVVAQSACFVLQDRDTHTISGVVNSYYPGSTTAIAGSTSISIGPGRGAGQSIQSGDLLVVIQMQDAFIDYSNNSAYGSGGTSGSGYTDPNNVGRYEYVVAASAVDYSTGGVLSISGVGAGDGLLYTYSDADASLTGGQRRFQVVLVPGYLNAILGGSITALPWDGSTGGIAILEVVNDLNFNGNAIYADTMGFRGGGGRQLAGSTGLPDTDFRTSSTLPTNGSKGEGIAGTPRYVFSAGAVLDTTPPTGTDGYPDGSHARGAPGNAGGGGTDGNPPANDENSGGGGGGNGGAGGQGGFSWNSAKDVGGRGGAAFIEAAADRMVLGGGGGSGTTNNGTGTPANGVGSSGAPGGGGVFLRLGQSSGTGSITANGASSLDVERDSTGGGGAGGSIVAVAELSNAFSNLSIFAAGGDAGDAWPLEPPGGDPGERHGPGGGGGGGAIFLSSTASAINVNGGTNGTTTDVNDPFGAQPGSAGITSTSISTGDIPGVPPGYVCYTPTSVHLVAFEATSSHADVKLAVAAFLLIALVLALVRRLQRRLALASR